MPSATFSYGGTNYINSEVSQMKVNLEKKAIPTLKFNSDYFKCPRCGWRYPDPLLIKGDVAPSTKCQNCGHSYLVRIK